ncbi:MAG: CrcB family protein [Elusimicrobia bacterium]|nr:CrcB family protein [Elusimicrobiota bacterium]
MSIVALLAGGIAGVLARYAVALSVFGLVGGWLPWGTLVVNLTGCFLIGLFDAAAAKRGFGGPHGRMLLMTGFCGAYTTFSSLILEFDALLRAAPLRGAAYVLVSVAAGLALFRAGAVLGAH